MNKGIKIKFPANSLTNVKAEPVKLYKNVKQDSDHYDHNDHSITYLDELDTLDAQRGVGLPKLIFEKNKTFQGNPILIDGKHYEHGLGLAANTVVLYDLDEKYRTLSFVLGMDNKTMQLTDPSPSVYLTLFADGKNIYESGPVTKHTLPQKLSFDVKNCKVLTIRVSGNWDDNGNLSHDFINMGDAKLRK